MNPLIFFVESLGLRSGFVSDLPSSSSGSSNDSLWPHILLAMRVALPGVVGPAVETVSYL